MRTSALRRHSQDGAVLIHVAIALLGLVAFSSFVVDYGIMWVSRGQAQTSADAAVLAAAQSMAFDNTADTAHFQLVGQKVGQSNLVFGQPPDIQLTDITFPNCPPTLDWSTAEICVQAQVYRTQPRGTALPTFFGRMVGIANHGVRATATARAIAANATNCLKPWTVGDKWLDSQAGGWSQTAEYNAADGDSYTPPTADDPGTGFSEHDANGNPTYYGYQMVLKLANPGQGANEIPINSAGWAMELDLTNPSWPNGGNQAYVNNITGCTSDVVVISPPGGTCPAVDPSKGCLDVKTGSGGATNKKAVEDFIAANDPGATWTDGANGNWRTGKINSTQSPSRRIVPIAIFDVPEYLAAGYTGTSGIIRVVNIVGFFLEGTCQSNTFTKEPYLECPGGGSAQGAVVGRLVSYPGLSVAGGGSVAGAFGSVIILVR
jgi:hypothetical protein